MASRVKGRPIQKAEWKLLFKKNSPRNDEFNVVRLLPIKLALMCGMRELEIALLPMSLIVNSNGTLNEILVLPQAIAHKGKERPVIIPEELHADFELYLQVLRKYGINSWPHPSYCGFDPNSLFVVDESLTPYTTQCRGRTSSSKRVVAKGLNDHMDRLIKNAGLDVVGVNRKSLLRTFTIEAVRCKWSIQDVALMSGLSQDSVAQNLVMDVSQYSPLSNYFSERENRKNRVAKLRRRWTFEN